MTEEPESWSIETLRAILQERDVRYAQRFIDMERALTAALVASEKAIIKAEVATEKRFESVNEFRTTLSDQATNFVTRAEFAATTERDRERLTELTDRLNKSEGRGSGLQAGWVYLLGAVAALGTLVSMYLLIKP